MRRTRLGHMSFGLQAHRERALLPGPKAEPDAQSRAKDWEAARQAVLAEHRGWRARDLWCVLHPQAWMVPAGLRRAELIDQLTERRLAARERNESNAHRNRE